jgi:hypothetical protein
MKNLVLELLVGFFMLAAVFFSALFGASAFDRRQKDASFAFVVTIICFAMAVITHSALVYGR